MEFTARSEATSVSTGDDVQSCSAAEGMSVLSDFSAVVTLPSSVSAEKVHG